MPPSIVSAPAPPIRSVRGAIADKDVGEIVASSVDRCRSSQRQVLDVAYGVDRIGEAETDRRLNQVRAVAAGLVDHIARIVDHIGVVARATEHRVRTGTAVQDVRGAIADKDVGEIVARAVDRCRSSQRQVLDVAYGVDSIGKAETDRRLNQVRAVATGLVDHVARIVDHIGVVARATEHRVRTGTAIRGCSRRYCR